MRRVSGFYGSSLEMLLDTMCNVLGGVIFIALLVALLAKEMPAPQTEDLQSQTAELTNQLAALTVSNEWLQAELQQLVRHIQQPPGFQTNQMRLPNLSQTSKRPWPVIITNGQIYPVYFLSRTGAQLNAQALVREANGNHTPLPGKGEDPERGVARMVASFRQFRDTNHYFIFAVYEDSFLDFMRARATAARLGFQCGWEPVVKNLAVKFDREGEQILPQN